MPSVRTNEHDPVRFAVRGNLLTGSDLDLVPDGWLIVDSGRIVSISPTEEPPPRETLYDYSGCTILPGLIDTHCHLCLPGDGRDVNRYLEQSGTDVQLAVAARNAKSALYAGITTLRDLGAPAEVAFRLRHASDCGLLCTPRLVLAGPVLTETGGHGYTFGSEVDSAEDIRKAVRRLCRQGADVIKVMASGGSTPGTNRWCPAFDVVLLRGLAEEAHSRGISVTAHATCPQAIENALRAGFDGLEHAEFWIDNALTVDFRSNLAAGMAEQGMFVAPTLQTSYRILHQLKFLTPAERARRERIQDDALAVFSQLLDYNIPFVTGSDAGFLVTRFDELWLGLRLMVQCGMSIREALRSATVRAADALGLTGITGVLAPGYQADLLVVDGDPLSEIDTLAQVHAVFQSGIPIRTNRWEERINAPSPANPVRR